MIRKYWFIYNIFSLCKAYIKLAYIVLLYEVLGKHKIFNINKYVIKPTKIRE